MPTAELLSEGSTRFSQLPGRDQVGTHAWPAGKLGVVVAARHPADFSFPDGELTG